MQEELDQFQKNDVWKLVELPKGKKVVEVKKGPLQQTGQKW